MNELVFEIIIGILIGLMFIAVVAKIFIDDFSAQSKKTRIRYDDGIYFVEKFMPYNDYSYDDQETAEWTAVKGFASFDEAALYVMHDMSERSNSLRESKSQIVLYMR